METYELLRPAGVFETMYKVHQKLGVLSNIIVCASYERADKAPLTPPMIYAALSSVISEQPALATIMVDQPSVRKKGNKRTWQAHLKKIHFKECVKFVDNTVDNTVDKERFIHLLEEEHDTWFNTEDKTKPLWRIVVVNGTKVLFVFHHSICDGKSGMIFHRNFLAALNKVTEEQQEEDHKEETLASVHVTNPELKPESLTLLRLLGMNFNVWIGLLSYISSLLIKFFLRKKYTFFTDAVLDKFSPSVGNPVPVAKRPVTKIESLRLSAPQLAASLQACKNHKSSITTLIDTLLHVTLATDLYPTAKMGQSYFAVDLRRFLPPEYSNTMGNFVSSHQFNNWLSKYRKAGPMHSEGDDHIALIWKLSQTTKAALHSAMFAHKTPLPVANVLGLAAIGEDDESVAAGIYSLLDVAVAKSFCVSSLVESDTQSSGPWWLKDIEFSSSAQKSEFGPMLYFAIASVRGGECVINVSHEEGTLKPGIVRTILEGLEKRLAMLLEAEDILGETHPLESPPLENPELKVFS